MTLSVIPRERAVDIDTELDFRLVESLMARNLEHQ
jgi:CMP-N-acetylneuraminic acid synthetase